MQEFLRIRHFGIARKENTYKKGTVPGGTVPFFNMLGKFFPNILKNAPLRMRTYNELRTDTKKHLDEGNENGYNIVTSL